MVKKTTETKTTKPRSGSETRQRQHFMRFRVNDAEKQQIEADAERAGLTVASYLRQLAVNAPIPKQGRRPSIEKQDLARLLGHIGKIGSNINQIARAANANIPYSQRILETELTALKNLRNDIRKTLGRK